MDLIKKYFKAHIIALMLLPVIGHANCYFDHNEKTELQNLTKTYTWGNDHTGIGRRAHVYIYDSNGNIIDTLVGISSHTKAEIASTQKIITAYMLSQNNDLSYNADVYYDRPQRSLDAMGTKSGRDYIRAVKKSNGNINVRNHLRGLLNKSTNSSGRALALYNNDSERAFMTELNTEMADMLDDYQSNTCLQNGHGLQPFYSQVNTGHAQSRCGRNKQFSTAENMARLVMKFSLNDDFRSVLRDAGLDADRFHKTGFTSDAGAGRVGAFKIKSGACAGNYVSFAFYGGRTGQRRSIEILHQKLINRINRQR